MNIYFQPLIKVFEANADPENAAAMKQYMKGQFEYYGIKSPQRRELAKVFFKCYNYPSPENLDNIVKVSWDIPQREMQYVVMDMLRRFVNTGKKDQINLYEYLIIHRSWWDTIDFIAVNLVGGHFQQYPGQIKPYTEKWMKSGNIWLQRTAILFQLKYKKNTDLELLSTYIKALQGTKEFFINKAIGWILREYSKQNAEWVIEYVKENELAPLSKREALKWLGKISN